jgi:hypothetical protein
MRLTFDYNCGMLSSNATDSLPIVHAMLLCNAATDAVPSSYITVAQWQVTRQ